MSVQYNDTTNKQGLIQECERKLFGADYGAISGSQKVLDAFRFYINEGVSKLSAITMESDGRWQWHDTNYSTHPISNTDLNDAQTIQQDYKLADIHLKLLHVYVKDVNGNYQPLKPIDEHDAAKNGVAPTELFKDAGMPKYYDKKGRSLLLYPAPAADQVTESEGLRVSYQSSASYFADGDTTKTAGFAIPFQNYPALHACYMYATNNQMTEKSNAFKVQIEEMEIDIREFYNRRDKDDKPQLRTRKRNYS